MKKFIAFLLACSMVLSCGSITYATSASQDTAISTQTEADTAGSEDTADANVVDATAAQADPKAAVPAKLAESSPANPIGRSSSYYNITTSSQTPDITAESAYLMDAKTGAVLYSKEGDTTRYPASITKVMTALVTLEHCNLSDIVTFSSSAVYGIEEGSSTAGINVGAELTVEDVLYALMLVSANEAGAALAEHVAGSTESFADMMNETAARLGCTNTHFTNPHGLPDPDHTTTAHDMALILQAAMQHEEFRKIAGTISYTLEASDTLTDTLELWNHAKILRDNSEYYYEYTEGAKTGYTSVALNTLVTYAKKDDVELICVILKDYGAACSYEDSANLYRWGFEQVKSLQPLTDYNLDSELTSIEGVDEKQLDMIHTLPLEYAKDYYVLVPADFDPANVSSKFVYEEDKDLGILGHIDIYSGDLVIGSAPVTYDLTSSAAQEYIDGANSGNVDDLETAKVDESIFSPKKILSYLLRLVLCIALVYLIMFGVRKYLVDGNIDLPFDLQKPVPTKTPTPRRRNTKRKKTTGKTGTRSSGKHQAPRKTFTERAAERRRKEENKK